jgi:hypothetical protein
MCLEACQGPYPEETHISSTHVVNCYRYRKNGKEGEAHGKD